MRDRFGKKIKCPKCGEKKSTAWYIKKGKGLNKGISGGIYNSWYTGIFKKKYMRVDYYFCNTCGNEWESEEYEW